MPSALIKTPEVIKKIFSKYIWNVPCTEKIIYLTFDDGPTPEITNWTLKILKAYNAKATFFCVGKNIDKYLDVFKQIIAQGHGIGNHTQNHIKGWKTKTSSYLKDIKQAQHRIDSEFQQVTINPLFRPPYGQITPKQGRKLIALNYKIIMWDVISFDWDKNMTPQQCLKNVISKTKNGSIVVFHDSIKASKNMQYALPKVLEHFSHQGYIFKALEV